MVGLDEVAELRSLLRRADRVARQLAYSMMDDWSGEDLDELGARAALEAAAGSYPSIDGDHRDPGESLVRVLWERPRLVAAEDALRCFLLAGVRARRALIHLLALRRDSEGLEAVEHLFDPQGPRELLPAAMMPVLDPLLEAGPRDRVTALLCRALLQEGWVWHASDLLSRMQRTARPAAGEQARVLAAVTAAVEDLVAACDRASPSSTRTRRRPERVRSERESLVCLARLLDHLDGIDITTPLQRMLASADPRVAALGAVRLLGADETLAPERLWLIARDPVARADLYDGLERRGALSALHGLVDDVAVHEAMLARWLAEVTELGQAPDEIEFVTTRSGPRSPQRPGTDAVVYLYRFRLHAPHWSSARGWMIGLSGPWTGSCYAAEDEFDLATHVEEIRSSLATWPRREDGAA